MLPTPVSLSKRKTFRRNATTSRYNISDLLLRRARVTNLALVFILSFTAFSLLFNVVFYLSSTSSSVLHPPQSILSTLSRDTFQNLNHLIIVPGHAVWKGDNSSRRLDESEWILEPYQKGGGRVAAFFSHISLGAELAINDERALLVFSGGQTRSSSTTTEAESYLRLALNANVFDIPAALQSFPRATTENYALDSFQNLLFSIARFHEYTGRYPEQITVVGYEMKRRRFTELHRAALRWPRQRFIYIGVDPEGEHGAIAQAGEQQNGYTPYSQDIYGCHSTLLSKRRQRNPSFRFHPYYSSSPELIPLLDWCPSHTNNRGTIFNGPLPW